MKGNFKNKGFTLVEVIISMAIISIIAVSMLNVFGIGFSNIFRSGRNSKDYYEAAGELEIATLNPDYIGKEGTDSIKNKKTKVTLFENTIFEKDIETRFIKSKIGNLDSALEDGDNYLYIYSIDEKYIPGQAFISKNDLNVFEEGDIPVAKGLLEGDYKYTGEGRLVIPSQEALVLDSEHPINWEVKDGIIIKDLESPNYITLSTINLDGIILNSSRGDIIINGTNIESGGKVIIKSKKELEMRNTISKSKIESIRLESDKLIDVRGTSERPTEISITGPGSEITFIVNAIDGVIYSNINTYFKKDGIATLAINKNSVYIKIDNETNFENNDKFK